MAQDSYPWTGNSLGDCGPYSASEMATWNWMLSMTNMENEGVLLSDGVFDENYNCTGAASPITAHRGRCAVRGRLGYCDADEQFTISTPVGGSRQDLLILRVDYNAQTVRLAILPGNVGGGDPALTRTDGVKWEIPLWRITITTGGAITLTDLRQYCHFRTKVSTKMLDDGVLAATAEGRLKIATGYFTSAERTKFATGFVNTALLEDGLLTADAAGRLKMADQYVDATKVLNGIDLSGTTKNANVERIHGRNAPRAWSRLDGGATSMDDEFDALTLDGKWIIDTTCSQINYNTNWSSHMWCRFDNAWEYVRLVQPFAPGSADYNFTALFRSACFNTESDVYMFVSTDNENDGIYFKYHVWQQVPTYWEFWCAKKVAGGFEVVSARPFPGSAVVCLSILREGTYFEFNANFGDDHSYWTIATTNMSFVTGKIQIGMHHGSGDVMGSSQMGIDWFRKSWVTT